VKGTDVLLHSAAQVCLKYPKAMFLIAGCVHDPGYYGELKELVRGLGLTRNIRFLGTTDQVWSLLKLCDVFCLLSRSEGMSNALLEAMASGLPCVASAVGGTPEMIEDGRSGYLVPSEDPDAAADRILRLLDDPEGARRMGAEGRCVVGERYSAQRMIDRIVASYDQLLEVRRTV
jgi:glycosyltransferase involved in cell wall biosynthesis